MSQFVCHFRGWAIFHNVTLGKYYAKFRGRMVESLTEDGVKDEIRRQKQ